MKTRGIRASKRKKPVAKKKGLRWELRLYVADTTARSVLAQGNLRALCEHYLSGQYRLTIIDLVKQPGMARQDEVLATPTLVRVLPEPQRIVIGSLTNTERVLRALEFDQSDKLRPLLTTPGVPVGHA
jgi:circadian clock protein KaiB